MSLKFQKRIENFVCENCQNKVKGGGYTNHCPGCLYSKHVDQHPGDRGSECHGLMAPVQIITKKQKQSILQRCLKCGLERLNKVSTEDDIKAILGVIRNFELIKRRSL